MASNRCDMSVMKKSQCEWNKTSHHEKCLKQCFNKEGYFIRLITMRHSGVVLTGFKNIPGKVCAKRQLCFCRDWKLVYGKQIRHWISYMFWTFLLLAEEGMASCCRAFQKNKDDEEERNLMENATRIRQYVQWQSRHYFVFPWYGRMLGKRNKI